MRFREALFCFDRFYFGLLTWENTRAERILITTIILLQASSTRQLDIYLTQDLHFGFSFSAIAATMNTFTVKRVENPTGEFDIHIVAFLR
jgi:hypothetical protein